MDVADWIGRRLADPGHYDPREDLEYRRPAPWPDAAWGAAGERAVADVSRWPQALAAPPLESFLGTDWVPLSARATRGFLGRAHRGSLRFPAGFLDILERHAEALEKDRAVGAAD